jgi:hypothetical protein
MTDIKPDKYEKTAKNMLSLTGPQLFEACGFMKQMTPEGKLGITKLANLLFRRGVESERLLATFEPAKSVSKVHQSQKVHP